MALDQSKRIKILHYCININIHCIYFRTYYYTTLHKYKVTKDKLKQFSIVFFPSSFRRITMWMTLLQVKPHALHFWKIRVIIDM